MPVALNLDTIEFSILTLRGQRVLLSGDLARLYGVQPKALMQAVKRNIERFPADFLFQLEDVEWLDLKSQTVTSSWGGAFAGHAAKSNPIGFTAKITRKEPRK